MKKRNGSKKATLGEIRVNFGNLDGQSQIVYSFEDTILGTEGTIGRPTIRLLMDLLENTIIYEEKTLAELLQDRGYDLTTLEFKIKRRTDEKNLVSLPRLRPLYRKVMSLD